MKTRNFAALFFMMLFSVSAFSQVLPKPRQVDKDYRSEYRQLLNENEKIVKRSDADIQLPVEEMTPIEVLTPTEFSSTDFTNWGKKTLAPDGVIARIVAAARYKVLYDVYDTGVKSSHIDLQEGRLYIRDGIGEPGDDGNGHGTHVLGTTVGKRGGVVYELLEAGFVQWGATKVLSRTGSGSFSNYASMHETGFSGIYKEFVDEGGFVVTNQSLGYNGQPLDFVESALAKGYNYGGITHVAAAGNSNSDVDYPGSSPYTIAVGAVDRNLHRASFSCYGEKLNVVAPGVMITAPWKDGGYATISGTSMASPFVSGFVVAAYAVWGDKLSEGGRMEAYLHELSRDLGNEGFDQYYGWGLAILNKIPDSDPDEVLDGAPIDDDPIDPPVEFKSTVSSFFPNNDHTYTFRFRRESDRKFEEITVSDLLTTTTSIGTQEQVYDMTLKMVEIYFSNTAMVIPNDIEFGYSDTAWWIGQFLEYHARNNDLDIQLQSLRAIDEKGRSVIVTGFDRAGLKQMNRDKGGVRTINMSN